MTEALINYVGEIPYRPGGAVELHPFVPCFEVTMGDEPLFKVWVQLSWEGSINAIRQLEGQGFPATAAEQLVSQALVLHGTRRLEQVVIEWLSTDTKPLNTSDVWNLTTDDVLHLLAPVRRKVCSNQQRSGRDLYCTAASEKEATYVISGRRAAPTSTPICRSCALPDSRYLCSHLMHPDVIGSRAMGGVVRRTLAQALCDMGSDKITDPGLCHASGHRCWQRIVEVEPPPLPSASPLELAEAFDVLDAVWRLAFDKKKPLLSLSMVATPAALSLGCATRAEFEARISDLADLIDRIKVDEAHLRPGTDKKKEISGSLDALTNCLHHHLDPVQRPAVDRAIKTLRTVRQARNAEQHGLTEGGGLTAKLRDLGVHDAPPNWGAAWDVVRARVVEALTDLRHELMTWVNTP